MSSPVADVLIPLALDTAYSYAVPDGLALAAGDVVQVPLGPRETVGVVWGLRDGPGSNFKPVSGRVEAPSLTPAMRRFLDWIAWYTLAPRGSVLALALRLPDAAQAEVPRVGVRLVGPPPQRLTPARARVLKAAEGGLVHRKQDLARAAGVGVGVLDGLVDEGTLTTVALAPQAVAEAPDPEHPGASLSPEQHAAAADLVALVRRGDAAVALLEGVTGSGKTEVYFEAVAETVRQGRQALILMPEIALTAQFLDRFAARFGCRPAVWHSGVAGRRRERLYAGIAEGEVAVVAGARSALFLPYAKLGLIVVDEEHEAAYKQEDGVHYHARDMAVVRGRTERAPVLLASATPSIESRVNAERGRYGHVVLPERFGGRPMPQIRAVDLRREEIREGTLALRHPDARHGRLPRARRAVAALSEPPRLCAAHPVPRLRPPLRMPELFRLARRAPLPPRPRLPPLRPPRADPAGVLRLRQSRRAGVMRARVERIAEEVAERFPGRRSIVLSSDFPGGIERLRTELAAVASGGFDIVIGTQLVAKGHNFPLMTLVGVLDADIGLTSGDPRAAERTFQLLQQVTGRAGRGDKPGRALVQTWQPDHPVIAALISGDAERFYREESEVRELAGLPPFGRLAAVVVSAADRPAAEAHARAMAQSADPPPGVTVLGPAEAPLAMIRGRHRFRLLVKTERDVDLQAYLRAWLARCPKPRGSVKASIDVDPQSFL